MTGALFAAAAMPTRARRTVDRSMLSLFTAIETERSRDGWGGFAKQNSSALGVIIAGKSKASPQMTLMELAERGILGRAMTPSSRLFSLRLIAFFSMGEQVCQPCVHDHWFQVINNALD